MSNDLSVSRDRIAATTHHGSFSMSSRGMTRFLLHRTVVDWNAFTEKSSECGPGPLMIEVENLSKSFGRVSVIRDLSFRVERGEVCRRARAEWRGKSTLLRCLNGLVSPSGGSVAVDGIPVDCKNLAAVRKRVGFIFQGVNVHGNLTVLRNVLIGRARWRPPWAVTFSDLDRRVALEAIDRVALDEKVDARTSTLSGGQRQRVGIARAALAA